jgi:signal transduction histidine kinase
VDARVRRVRAPSPVLLWAVVSAGCAAAATTVAVDLTSDQLSQPVVHTILLNWITLPYVFGGVIAWWRRPESRFGPLMVAAGFGMFLSSLNSADSDLLFTIGSAFDLLVVVLFLHVFLAFPSGRLESRVERILVSVGYVVGFGLQLVGMALGSYGADSLLTIVSKPGVTEELLRGQLVAISALCLAGVAVLAARRRRAGRPLRGSVALLVDSFALGLVMSAALFMSHVLGSPVIEPIRWAFFAVIGLAAIAFLVGLLQARLARSALGELLVELRGNPAPAHLRDSLARALRDPSLTLAYWLPDYEIYADLDGRPLALPEQDRGRATTLIERDGVRVAALVHDRALDDEPELLDAVSAAAGIALENGRLHAELRARVEELRGARARIVEATRAERQQLERNLHDGAQQRLVALSLELGRLETRVAGDPETMELVERTKREATESLRELRELAHGIHPALVTDHGLTVALEALAARSAIPIELDIRLDHRLPEAVEVAAYYVVAESVTNVAKYACATTTRVSIRLRGGRAVVEVIDDGVGGAETTGGSGLRGLADRVEALGGRLRVWSPKGGGTKVRAEMPCA